MQSYGRGLPSLRLQEQRAGCWQPTAGVDGWPLLRHGMALDAYACARAQVQCQLLLSALPRWAPAVHPWQYIPSSTLPRVHSQQYIPQQYTSTSTLLAVHPPAVHVPFVAKTTGGSHDPAWPALLLSAAPQVAVHVSATVFSRKKGTPGLKPHVRCLGFSADTDTEAASDWHGFE